MAQNLTSTGRDLRLRRPATADPALVRAIVIGAALLFVGLFLLVPLVAVFSEALRKGVAAYLAAISDPEARSAIGLTLLTAAIVVPLNVGFGLAAAWAIANFEFAGKNALTTIIDLPVAISPVISGMVFVLLLGTRTPLGGWLADHGLRIIFAEPGIILATIFVTFPLAARELIPVMQAAGTSEEEAAVMLGANGWQTFRRVTLPKVKLGVLYGMVLCNARAMGEFGAVSVVSGHIRGYTDTMPLYVEILYNDYRFAAAFAVASLLTLLALATLALKSWLERRGLTRAPAPPEEVIEQAAA
jgi:sulfate/thiosulfate transport system permease protein